LTSIVDLFAHAAGGAAAQKGLGLADGP
jgi:hypothetical protein